MLLMTTEHERVQKYYTSYYRHLIEKRRPLSLNFMRSLATTMLFGFSGKESCSMIVENPTSSLREWSLSFTDAGAETILQGFEIF